MAENRFRVRKSKVEDILFDTTITPIDQVEGLMQWNETDGTLDLTLQGGTVTQQIGQELLVKCRNGSDAPIDNGTPVYISGRQGNRVKIFPARSDVDETAFVFGVATEDIADNSDGYVTTFGYVRQIKTDYSGTGVWGVAWQESDNLYVSKTVSGQLTNVEPDAPHHSDIVGQVGVVGGAGIGSIFINIRHHTTIEKLSDVNGTPLTTNGQLMVWNNSSGYFDFDYNINDFALTGDLSSYATIDYVTGISGDLQTTIDGLDASNHVPYNGATGDVDLGVHNIVATTGEFTNLDISSNIVVDGTVDGRDIAADGSTLDSLVAATGNYVLDSETGSAATLASGVLLDRANHTGTQTLSTISDAGTIASFNSGDYLNTARTGTYTPTADYHPATKKYVDDNIITDHGGLAGLGDDDHTQYFTTGRADSRYSQLGHTHVVADISNSGLLLDRANHTGTQTASTISDFDTEVSNNTDVSANTSGRHDAVTVTDSSEIDFTLVGQDITASLKTGSIDETKLDTSVNDSLDLADSSVQPADIGTIASFNSGDFVDVYNNQTINGEKTFASDIYAQSNAFVGTDLTVTGDVTLNSGLYLNNAKPIYWKDNGGTYREMFNFNANNDLVFGSNNVSNAYFQTAGNVNFRTTLGQPSLYIDTSTRSIEWSDRNGSWDGESFGGSQVFQTGVAISGDLGVTGNLGVGTSSPSAKIHSLSTSEQLRLGYDASNYLSFTVGSAGELDVDSTNGEIRFNSSAFIFEDSTNHGTRATLSSNDLYLGFGSNNAIVIEQGGPYVAIKGTPSASYDFEVFGTSYTQGDADFDANVNITSALDVGTNCSIGGHLSAATKSFLIDNPTKEGKKLQYGVVESDQHSVFVRGKTDKKIIELPEEWEWLVHEDSVTVQLTPVGKSQQLYIIEQNNKIVHVGGVEGEFNYTIYGERKDVAKLETEV
jgi:hypothetical protein